MKKIITILLLFVSIVSLSQDYRSVDWKTKPAEIRLIGVDTFKVTVNPIDYNDKGVGQVEVGYYLIDWIARSFEIIAFEADTITVVDLASENLAPVENQIAHVYESIVNGDTLFKSTGGVDVSTIDDLSRWKDVARNNELFGRAIQTKQDTMPFEVLIMDTTYTPTGLEEKGTSYWDDGTGLISTVLGDGVVYQEGNELYGIIRNDNAYILEDGRPIAISGTLGASGKITGDYAIANNSYPSDLIIGVATQDIAINGTGKVTVFGQVKGIQTDGLQYGETWNDADVIYASPYTKGYLTSIQPPVPYQIVKIGVVIYAHATNGILGVRPTYRSKLVDMEDVNGTPLVSTGQFPVWDEDSSYFDFNYNINSYTKGSNEITKEPTGFFEPENVISTYNTTNRTVTLTGTVLAMYEGDTVSFLVNGWTSPAHDATDGGWFLYSTGTESGDLVWSQTPWDFNELQISYAYYSATDQFALREVHGLMGYQTHKEFHELLGTYFNPSTSNLSDYTLSSTSDRQPDVSTTTMNDEDLQTILPVLTSKLYTRAYLTGTGLIPTFDKAQTDIVSTSGNRPYWNEYTTTWDQTLMVNNSYMIVWLVETPQGADAESQAYGRLWVQGQINTTSLDVIAERSFSDIQIGSLGLTPEFVATHKITLQYTAANWNIEAVEKLTGSKISQTASTPPSGLVTVTTDNYTIGGTGELLSPIYADTTVVLTVNNLTDSLDNYLLTRADTIGFTLEQSQVVGLEDTLNTIGLQKVTDIDSVTNNQITVNFTSNDDTEAGLVINRGATAETSDKVIGLLVKNEGEVAGVEDWQNEAVIAIQAGTTNNHRRYIEFKGYDFDNDWIIGANASNTWIHYNAIDGTHRMLLNPQSAGGDFFIASEPNGKVIFNSSTNPSGTSGIEIHNGGTGANTRWWSIASDMIQYDGAGNQTGFNINASGDITGNDNTVNGSVQINSNSPVMKFNELDETDKNWAYIASSGNFTLRTAASDFVTYDTKLTVTQGGLFGFNESTPETMIEVTGGRIQVSQGADTHLVLGGRESAVIDGDCNIMSSFSGGSYPFNGGGNLVLKSRSNDGLDIVTMTGTTPTVRTILDGGTGNLLVGHTTNVDDGVNKIQVNGSVIADAYSTNVQTLTETSGAVAWDMSSGSKAKVTIDETTIITITNMPVGAEATIRITQGDAGDDNVTFVLSGATVEWRGDDQELTDTSGASDYIKLTNMDGLLGVDLDKNYVTQ